MNLKSLAAALGISMAVSSCVQYTNMSENGFRDSERWGKVVKKQIEVSDFTGIELSGNFDVEYVQGDQPTAFIEGNEKVISYHHVEVENGTLVDHTSKDAPYNLPSVRIVLTSPTLSNISLSGAGDIDIDHKAQLGDINIQVSGAGDVDIENLNCQSLTTAISGAGDITIDTLTCTNVNSTISGAGDIKLENAKCEGNASLSLSGAGDLNADIKCTNMYVQVSGAGDAKIKVKCHTLTVDASGTGHLDIKGKAEVLHKSESGLAIVDTEDLSVKEIKLK